MIQHWLETSTLVMGVHLVVTELMFTFYKDPEQVYAELTKFERYISKPLWYCPTCMASVWGTVIHFALGGTVAEWIPTLFAVACINTIIAKWINH